MWTHLTTLQRRVMVIVASVVIAIVLIITGGDDEDDEPNPMAPSAETCANLQALIDGGLSRRDAYDLAIRQADQPGAENILRNMLDQC